MLQDNVTDINYPYDISDVIMDTNKSFIKTLRCVDARIMHVHSGYTWFISDL